MKGFKRGEKGFTLVELLIVVAILGILAAVVIPNVVGLLGRGGKQAYETDSNTVELAAAAFYSDVHTGWWDVGDNDDTLVFTDNVWGDSDAGTVGHEEIIAGHYFPTAIAKEANHYITIGNVSDPDNINNPIIVLASAPATAADIDDISIHAIWMGLLVNPVTATYYRSGGFTGVDCDRWLISALPGESELYLDEMPQSAMTGEEWNGDPDPNSTKSGGYVWIVGSNGQTYGVYAKTCTPGGGFVAGDYYFAGFSGSYP